jgi:phosphatidyl-myo-inositol dimannoside synthase
MADALMVTSSFLPGRGGIESYLAQLCADVAPRLAALAPARRGGETLPQDLSYVAEGYPGSMLWPGRAVLRAMTSTAARLGANRVLFGTPWPLGLLGPALAKRGMHYAAIVHGAELTLPSALPGLKKRTARSLAGADLLLPVSEFTSQSLARLIEGSGFSLPPRATLHARIDLRRFTPEVDVGATRRRLGIGHDEKVVLCFGRLVKRKGFDRAIRALAAIAHRVPETVLVIGGTGPEERRLKALAVRAGTRIVFAGRVRDDEAPALHALADVFLLPVVDRYWGLEIEGLGVVLLEAAACATPCVTGRSGGTPEAVIDGRTGRVVDAHDQAELVDAVAGLLERPAQARAMGRAGRDHVARHFSREHPPEGLLDWLSGDIR